MIGSLSHRGSRNGRGIEPRQDGIVDSAQKKLGADGDEALSQLRRNAVADFLHCPGDSRRGGLQLFNRDDHLLYRIEVPELLVFVGLPGSGKSTYYVANFASTHLQVSKDLMRNVRGRDARQLKMIGEALEAGKSVVVDNTNPSPAIRAPLIALGRRHGARIIAYYFQCSVKQALMRNRQREGRGRVPDVAVFVTAKKLVPPVLDEGFDEVRVIACD